MAVSKNCFRLIDAETGQPFDIEDELGVYERLLAGIVNDIIHEHNFSRLRHTHPDDFPVEAHQLRGDAVNAKSAQSAK